MSGTFSTPIAEASAAAIAWAATLLRQGKLVAIPTETVYGLAANAFDAAAVQHVFAAKGRPANDPLIVHVALADGSAPDAWLATLHERQLIDVTALQPTQRTAATQLMRHFWPGPLTILLPKGPAIPPEVTSGAAWLALRAPAHPVAIAVLHAAAVPLAAPSANRFGRISPTTAQHVREELDGSLALILDGGACPHGIESTLVAFEDNGDLRILRPGAIAAEALQSTLVGRHVQQWRAPAASKPSDKLSAVPTPGTFSHHYAPRTPLVLLPGWRSQPATTSQLERQRAGTCCLLAWRPLDDEERMWIECNLPAVLAIGVLSMQGDLQEAAHHFYATLRRLDQRGADVIFADLTLPNTGLGSALHDRLQRARWRTL